MKRKNKNKKSNKIILIVSIVIVIILIILGIVLLLTNNKTNKEKEFTKLEMKETPTNSINKYMLYTNYEDLISDFKNSKITKDDFKDKNVLVIKVDYNPCSEEDITPVDYKINKNEINVKIEYTSVCGLCAPDELYYALKIDKTIRKPEVKIDSKALNDPKCDPNVAYKPMIYLYPKETQEVQVVLKNKDLLTTTYPKYKDSWNVIAYPDGTLVDKETKREYYGLYWEAKNNSKIDMKKGFVIKGEDTIDFLEEELKELGLNDKEANEFIVYWLPKLENNKYNYFYFQQTEEVNKYMPLEITPEPDSLIRILMYYKPLDKKIDVEEQTFNEVSRKDFTVVEWGGTKIN